MPENMFDTNPNLDENIDYQTTVKLIKKLHAAWVNEVKELATKQESFDHVKFSRLSVVAFMQMAAVLAVDTHMTLEQFLAVCAAQFKHSYEKAPKFN